MKKIKEFIKKIVYGYRASSEQYVKHLREIGVEVGEDVIIYAPKKTTIDEQYPWMITIGNHVRITEGVILLTHDYSWSVMKTGINGAILGASGHVTIGDNVFIGMNAIITRGVAIGDNVVIGAGSIVTGDCAENSVYAGNPARRICSISEFYEKRKHAQLQEATELALQYYQRFKKRPPEHVFHEYFMLFESRSSADQKVWTRKKLEEGNNYWDSLRYLEKHPPIFENYDAFWDHCIKSSDA